MPRKRPKPQAEKSPSTPSADQQQRARVFLRVGLPIALALMLLGLGAMAVLNAVLGWPWRLPIVRAVMLGVAFVACVGVMVGAALVGRPARRQWVWGCAAWSWLAVMLVGWWTYAIWPKDLLMNPPWLAHGMAGLVCVVVMASGGWAMGWLAWPLPWAAWRQGAVDGWRSDVARLPTGARNPRLWSALLAALGFVFMGALMLWSVHSVTQTVLYAAPQQVAIVEAPLTNVVRRSYHSRGGGGVITRWTVLLPTAKGAQPFEFDRKALFERHKALPNDHDDNNPHSPGRNCLFRSVMPGDVLTLRVRQDPLWGTAIDELLAIRGPSGPPCVTTSTPLE